MKTIHRINTVIYLTIIGLYIFQPILGALAQIGLGITQLIFAIKMTLEIEALSTLTTKCIKGYWLSIVLWLLVILLLSIFSNLDNYFISLFLVCPMIIGFYFVIITYLSQKNQLINTQNFD